MTPPGAPHLRDPPWNDRASLQFPPSTSPSPLKCHRPPAVDPQIPCEISSSSPAPSSLPPLTSPVSPPFLPPPAASAAIAPPLDTSAIPPPFSDSEGQLLSHIPSPTARRRPRQGGQLLTSSSAPLLFLSLSLTYLLSSISLVHCITLGYGVQVVSFLSQTCQSSSDLNGSIVCSTSFPGLTPAPLHRYYLSIGVVPSDFSQLDQRLQSVTLNGLELLSTEGCSPTGQCSLGSYFTCFQGDITNRISSETELVLNATASPSVQSTCSPCGSVSRVPCEVLLLQYTLFTVTIPTATPPPPPSPPSPLAPPPPASPPIISLIETPSSISNESAATFGWTASLSTNTESCYGCIFTCSLDSGLDESCLGGTYSVYGLSDGFHIFTLTGLSPSGASASVSFNWTIATQGPVPSLVLSPSKTSTGPVLLNITFDKPCLGNDGITCTNSGCEITVSAGAVVDLSTFTTLSPGLSYSVVLNLTASLSTEVNVTLAVGACSDSAGNVWEGGSNSTAILTIDLDRPSAVVTCRVPTQLSSFFQEGRSILTTNESPIGCSLAFSEAIMNVDVSQILVKNGTAANVIEASNTTFTFEVVPTVNGAVTVSLPSGATTDAVGNPNDASNDFIFFYDTVRPEVTLTSSLEPTTSDNVYAFLVSFSEPVLNFNSSRMEISNGEVICLAAADGGLGRFYQVSVAPLSAGTVRVAVPQGAAQDSTGNPSKASAARLVNYYEGGSQYRAGPYAVAGVAGWTAAVTASVTVAVAVRDSDPGASPGIRIVSNRPFRAVSTPVVGADPARNLLRMLMHLQVFALSEQLAVQRLPVFYRQMAHGLRWIYFNLPLPFKDAAFKDRIHPLNTFPPSAPGTDLVNMQPSCVWTYSKNATYNITSSLYRMSASPNVMHLHNTMHMAVHSTATNKSHVATWQKHNGRWRDVYSSPYRLPHFFRPRRLADNTTTDSSIVSLYGPEVLPPLTVDEYDYKTAWGNAFRTNFPDLKSDYHGWKEYVTVLFYATIFIIGISLLQVLLQLLCLMYRGQWLYGLLDPPRLQFFCIALSLVAISWGSALIIKGSTESGGKTLGLILGVVTINIWAVLFVLASIIVVWVVVVQEQFARFFVREMTEPRNDSFFPRVVRIFWMLLRQKRLKGHWVTITPAERHILPRLGIFFEDFTVWGLSGFFGVIKDRLRALYASVEYGRMIAIGVVFAIWTREDDSKAQVIALICITGANFLYLIILQPFTERGIQVAEAISLLCESALFGGALLLLYEKDWSDGAVNATSIVMLCLILLAFITQLINHWVALIQQMNRMFYPSDDEKSPTQATESEVYTDDDISGDVG